MVTGLVTECGGGWRVEALVLRWLLGNTGN